MENPEALGFHQETTKDPIKQKEQWEIQQISQDWFCIKPYFIYSRKLLQVSVTIQKFKIPDVIFNVSRNIIK